jgi:hypothetical protein
MEKRGNVKANVQGGKSCRVIMNFAFLTPCIAPLLPIIMSMWSRSVGRSQPLSLRKKGGQIEKRGTLPIFLLGRTARIRVSLFTINGDRSNLSTDVD